MTDEQCQSLARYIFDYIEYELNEYGREYDSDMIEQAIQAWIGGAR